MFSVIKQASQELVSQRKAKKKSSTSFTAESFKSLKAWGVSKVHRTTKPSIACIAFTKDGKHLLSGGADGQVIVQDLATEELNVIQSYALHSKPIISMQLNVAGTILVTCGSDRRTTVCKGEELTALEDKSVFNVLDAKSNKKNLKIIASMLHPSNNTCSALLHAVI